MLETPLPINSDSPDELQLNELQLKLRRVFVPFLLLYLGVVFVYVVLTVWLNAQQVPPLGQWWAHGVPVGMSLPVVFYLRPRLRFLEEDNAWSKTAKSGYGVFYLIMIGSIWISLWHINFYLELATGQLTALRMPAELLIRPATRFYTLEYALIKSRAILMGKSFYSYSKSGLPTAHIYLLCPLYISDSDSVAEQPPAWLGIECNQPFSINLNKTQELDTLRAVEQHWLVRLQNQPLWQVIGEYFYLERAGRDNDELKFREIFREQAPQYQVQNAGTDPRILLPRFEPLGRERTELLIRAILVCFLGPTVFWCHLVYTDLKLETGVSE